MDNIVSLENALLHQGHNIELKYNAKINAILHDAGAKIFHLQKKWNKLQTTRSRMIERENWEMVYKINNQQAEIVDEQYSISLKSQEDISRIKKKRDDKISIENVAFEKLHQYYLFLVGKNGVQKPNDAL